MPLADYRGEPAPPQALELPAGALVRLPSPDVNLPPPLPMLALPVADRVSVDDPTSEASRQAALAAAAPVRTTPTPFVRLTIPDPFEHARAVRLHTPPVEEPPHLVIRRP